MMVRLWFAALLAARGATAAEADIITESAMREAQVNRHAAAWYAWADERIDALRAGRPLPFVAPEPPPPPPEKPKRWWSMW